MKNKIPTADQILTEIGKLRKMKPTVLEESVFGDNHHNAIDRQIEVLEVCMSEDDLYSNHSDESDDPWAENEFNAALEAVHWMDGESEEGSPSNGWKPLVRK